MLFDNTDFSSLELPKHVSELRREVRDFLDDERRQGSFRVHLGHGEFDAEFSRKIGSRGWIGITWPRKYGGHEGSYLERFVVTEELLAAAAPVAAHWVADRQSGPSLLRWGTDAQRQKYLPVIAKGECYFAIGMSEPNSGSDLASVRTRAEKVPDGWKLTGQKVWSSWAHRAHAMFVLCRTSPLGEKKHEGLSQFIVDLPSPGITIRPIRFLNNEHHFNEVFFDEAFVPDEMVLGEIGQGWRQVTSELALERSGPERYMNTLPLLLAVIDRLKTSPDRMARVMIGTLLARFASIRTMSLAIATQFSRETTPNLATEAALVKDIGTHFEREVTEAVKMLFEVTPAADSDDEFERLLGEATIFAPISTIRGGTTQILRGIVAKRLEGAV
ncbi:MAG: acyl-CoA dehydrogenase [Betaproteobacteria bacterium RIFCSPLOWO2_12_FULL_62_58]|nr:MAG: acyl-CoA dehydrogenase [Betaproteobacteria bacterium RIFCSPLOWO2_12_FULL_62_58]